jgi:3-oxoacyl-[acyl-carrier protein] reductase
MARRACAVRLTIIFERNQRHPMDLGLKGKRAIVTGGTRGIGRAIVETLLNEGASVALCARKADEVHAAVTALSKAGAKVFGGVADIADAAQLKSWIDAAMGQLGGLDLLVCNASALVQGNAEDAWAKMFAVDVMGVQRAIASALPHLEQAAAVSGDAAIVIISSVSAAETSTANAYGALKAAQIHFAKGLAKEKARLKVRINVVSPGTVYFEGGVWQQVEKGLPELFKTTMTRNPTGRMATPQEIANAAVFLCSPASSYTTGINMVVDGAITSRVNF